MQAVDHPGRRGNARSTFPQAITGRGAARNARDFSPTTFAEPQDFVIFPAFAGLALKDRRKRLQYGEAGHGGCLLFTRVPVNVLVFHEPAE
jgi:hypothetical protein